MSASPLPRPAAGTPWLALIPALVLAVLWLWVEWCRFPWFIWNDVRLAPAFMAAVGEPVYSAPGQGVISTWMYGPVPLWLLRPATWMPEIGAASLMAGAVNILLPLAAITAACACWPAPDTTRRHRAVAVLVVVAIWPDAAWRFIQADNYVVAMGLLGCPFLFLASQRPWAGWVAAAAAAAAVGSKQIALGIPVAQLVWIFSVHGRAAARDHLLRLLACGGALAMAALLAFDPAGLWFNLVTIPGRLPFTDEPGRRIYDLLPLLAVHLALPAFCFWSWRAKPDPQSARKLAFLLWLCSLPLGAIALMKTGGTINSLHSLQLALPALALCWISTPASRPSLRWIPPVAAAAILSLRLSLLTTLPLRPAVDHLRQGVALASAHPGSVWFPWHPLVSYYAENRFYHAEDGFYVRLRAGRPASHAEAAARLPPRFSAIAEISGVDGWGISEELLPAPWSEQRSGVWRVRLTVPAPDAPPAH